jgi:antitoxin ParD1/3/4
MEEYNSKMEALQAHLAEGEKQAQNGEFIMDYNIESLLQELDKEE